MKTLRVIAILASAFLAGAGSAEMAFRSGVGRGSGSGVAKAEGSVGEMVSFEVRSEGATIARSRLVSPDGKKASVVLRDPSDPTTVRMILQVSTARGASGNVCVNYAVQIPELDVVRSGRVWVQPGVEQALPIGHDLVAVFTAMPVPSKAFDDWIRAERARKAPRAS
jgi:hypothetical protein